MTPRYAGANPPCSSTLIDKSFEVFILPFVEQGALYNAINQNLTIVGGENSTTHTAGVAIYACPSDPTAGSPRDLKPNALARYGPPPRPLASPGHPSRSREHSGRRVLIAGPSSARSLDPGARNRSRLIWRG